MTDLASSLDLIARLVKQFHTNRAAYHAPEYKEAHARQELIDPLFIALGWDVHNEKRAAPQYREVILEDSLEVEGEDTRKAPDYAFRVGETRKFFAEAKKPGVALKTAARPAYQLRRYAWSAKLPLSLLTDFEELGIYDCRSRPSEKDKATAGRINFYTFEEYPDRWREIWDVFSREAVWGGSFDRFTQVGKGRGTSEVDAEFLREIEGWRDVLAHNIAIRNPHLGIDDLNDAVQRTIDRIIFLRMAEDRHIEPYEQLYRLATPSPAPAGEGRGGGEIYAELIDLCRRADTRYNAGLFDLSPTGDRITPTLTVDDKVLKPIITGLYFPHCPYEFSVLPIMVLGNIYEQFLGKVIRLTASHQAKVEEKPEVRKAGGVFYTPTYIVDYNVKNTVGKMVQGKSPKQLASFRALDMACGSGSFLLGVYQCLLDYYLRWYTEHNPQKHTEAVWQQGDEWKLTIGEKKRILTTHIFGVDIDRQAVEVTKLSLLLKVLEGESTETLQMALPGFQERALPNLDNNIKCGNSLIGPDYFTGQLLPDADELRRVNPFDWEHEFPEAMKAGGFDCVVGNPPYVSGRETFALAWKKYIESHYQSYQGKYDLYIYFTEQAVKLLKPGGMFSFIIPNTLLANENTTRLREFILDNTAIQAIRVFDQRVFRSAQVESVIIVLQKNQGKHLQDTEVLIVSDHGEQSIVQESFRNSPLFKFNVRQDARSSAILEKIHTFSVPMGELADICIGIQLGGSRGNDTKESFLSRSRLSSRYKPVLDGKEINRYSLQWGKRFVKYGDWLHRKRDEKYFLNPKIVIRQIGATPVATFDNEGFYTLNTIYNVISPGSNYDLRYILGLLNSRLLQWTWRINASDFKSLFPKIKKEALESIPVRRINPSDPADVARHDRMVKLVEQMLELHKRLHATTSQSDRDLYQRQIDATDREIDRLVYELYSLTPDEIAIVEGQR